MKKPAFRSKRFRQAAPRLRRTASACLILFIAIVVGAQGPVTAISPEERLKKAYRGISFVDDPLPDCGVVGLGPTLDGHTLPAGFGGTGFEEPVNERGQVPSTNGFVTFANNIQNASTDKNLPDPLDPLNTDKKVSLQDLYRDYYITMRWRYALWNWDGSAIPGKESVDFYGKAPRVLVTNPRTGKSIVAVVLEAGPAPWTGVDTSSNNTPKQGWTNPQDGTPSSYKGRVSGFPPAAIKALEATMRMSDGSGDDLSYSWAPDQNALPGPYDNDVGEPADAADIGCPIAGLPIGEYVRNTDDMTCPVDPDGDISDGGIADGYAGGRLYKIRLCRVHGFRVNVLIAQNLDSMLDLAEAQGHDFGGGAFRTMRQQIDLRRINGCRDIYTSRSSECRTPTARPGYSNHQMGLAIDFTYNGRLIRSQGNNGFYWLSRNASGYGLKNFPVEPWHWSIDGK